MTDLLSRPSPPAPTKPAQGSTLLWGYGLVVAAWTAAIGITAFITVAVTAWFAADSGTFPDAIRIGALAWLLGNGGGLHLDGVAITLIPLGTASIVGLLLYRGGKWAGAHGTNSSWGSVVLGALAVGAGYCALALVVLALSWSPDVHADVVRTAVSTLLLGLVVGGAGVIRGSGRGNELLARLPEDARAALRGGLGGAAVLMAASATVTTFSLVAHFSTAVTLAESLHAGVVGGAVVALVGLALLPNAVLCAGAFLAGPGFTVGAGTVVAPGDVSTGPLPAVPLLAAVPRTDGSAWWEIAVLTVPLAAGAAAGLLAVRRYPVAAIEPAALRGGLAGLTAGVVFGLLTGLSGGAVGPGRMQDIGPYLLPTVVACAAACLLGGVGAAVSRHLLATRRPLLSRGRCPAGFAGRLEPADSDEPTVPTHTRK